MMKHYLVMAAMIAVAMTVGAQTRTEQARQLPGECITLPITGLQGPHRVGVNVQFPDSTEEYSPYDTTDQPLGMTGIPGTSHYDLAVYVNDPRLKGRQVLGLGLGYSSNSQISNFKFWTSSKLWEEGPDGAVGEVPCPNVNALFEGKFSEPPTCTGEPFYVGFSFDAKTPSSEYVFGVHCYLHRTGVFMIKKDGQWVDADKTYNTGVPVLTIYLSPATEKPNPDEPEPQVGDELFNDPIVFNHIPENPPAVTYTGGYQNFVDHFAVAIAIMGEDLVPLKGYSLVGVRATDFIVGQTIRVKNPCIWASRTTKTSNSVAFNENSVKGKTPVNFIGNVLVGRLAEPIECDGETPLLAGYYYENVDLTEQHIPQYDYNSTEPGGFLLGRGGGVGYYEYSEHGTVPVSAIFEKTTPSGVETIEVDLMPEYYDLMGRRVLEPQHGIYVKKMGPITSKVAL